MLKQTYHKKNELFEVEFYENKECTKSFDFTDAKDLYIELKDGDVTPLFYLPTDTSVFTPYIPLATYDNISYLYENRNICIQTLDEITHNLSKYIPEDNAVLFLSGKDGRRYGKMFKLNWFYHFVDDYNQTSIDCQFINQSSVSEKIEENKEILLERFYNLPKNVIPSKKFTIFLPHGTQASLEKANKVAEELKERYGVEEVNLFVLHCFQYIHTPIFLFFHPYTNKEDCAFNKIITTNSIGILPVQDNECLKVIDCKEIFEDYLKNV